MATKKCRVDLDLDDSRTSVILAMPVIALQSLVTTLKETTSFFWSVESAFWICRRSTSEEVAPAMRTLPPGPATRLLSDSTGIALSLIRAYTSTLSLSQSFILLQAPRPQSHLRFHYQPVLESDFARRYTEMIVVSLSPLSRPTKLTIEFPTAPYSFLKSSIARSFSSPSRI